MRHLRKGRQLGRNTPHRRALFRNMASSLILTEREIVEGIDENAPKVPGRIVTTLPKAKEIRPYLEKCITIAKKGIEAQQVADKLASGEERGSDAWKAWRKTEAGKKWAEACGPAVTARRRVMQLLRDPEAVRILFDKVAVRFMDRPGGYTRILKLAKPRLGDAGQQAILEFVGKNDRVSTTAQKPTFEGGDEKPAETGEAAE